MFNSFGQMVIAVRSFIVSSLLFLSCFWMLFWFLIKWNDAQSKKSNLNFVKIVLYCIYKHWKQNPRGFFPFSFNPFKKIIFAIAHVVCLPPFAKRRRVCVVCISKVFIFKNNNNNLVVILVAFHRALFVIIRVQKFAKY